MAGEKNFFERIVGESELEMLEFLDRVRENLGPEGKGVLYIPGGLSELECDHLYDRLTHPSVDWKKAPNVVTNQRGLEVTQNFSTHAIKLHKDTPETATSRGVRGIATKVQAFVRTLGGVYPSLMGWEVDEAVAQRYDEVVGLTWHKDLERHPGVIVSANISGTADLYYRMDETDEARVRLWKGDLVIVRATGLHGNWYRDLRPEHAVHNVHDDRISLTFRANTRPDDPIPSFQYNN